MQITFDTSSIRQVEAEGIIALLSYLFPLGDQPAAVPRPSGDPHPVPRPVASPSIAKVEHAVATQPSSSVPPARTPVNETPATARRGRRSKAEIASDALLEKGGHHLPTTGDRLAAAEAERAAAAAQTAQVPPPNPPTANGTSKPISADELRALLNGYIQKHSMEEAIGKLKSFNCSRVTDALDLAPEKLSQLAEALNG